VAASLPTTNRVLELARELGFDLVGIAPLRPPADGKRFEAWLRAGHHAGMAWMERFRERILDPRRILSEENPPAGGSLLVVGLGHARPAVELEGGGRVARYAAGRDYHNLLGKRLRKLARRLAAEGLPGRARSIVDAGPLLERSHAEEAGLGFASKAANLLHPQHGPWFFLGELVLEAELEPTASDVTVSCGTCTACLDACPTDALLEPGVLDSRRCISYQTIENRESIPHELRPDLGGWAFGCDVCSEVCPFGGKAPDTTATHGTHAGLAERSLLDWLALEAGRFAETFRASALRRPGRAGLARNAALALGHVPSERGRDALRKAAEEDPSPLVREAAVWSLLAAHGDDAGVRSTVDRVRAAEPDDGAAGGMARSLHDVP
jgi:epoxyqueuosine reductase